MNEASWDCPMCGNKNSFKNMNGLDYEFGLVTNAKCDNCREVSKITIEIIPVVTHVDVKL